MPVFNCVEYVDAAIGSIIAQTFTDFELLVSDDCSNDGSGELVERLGAVDDRIRVWRQDSNLGLVENYNFLFAKARAPFIAIQDADDWSDMKRLATQFHKLRDSEFALCVTGATYHFPNGALREEGIGWSGAISGVDAELPGPPATVMFRRSDHLHLGGWPLYFEGGTSMDRYFIMRLLEGRSGFHVGEALYHVNVRSASSHRIFSTRKATSHELFKELQSQRRKTGSDWLSEGNFQAMMEFETRQLKNGPAMAEWFRTSAVIQIDCGNLNLASRMIVRALTRSPTSILIWRSGLYLLREYARRFLASS